jgi:hypothetical protein
MKTLMKALVIAALSLSASLASASVITFSGNPATSFADGTFSTRVSGNLYDGFYTVSSTKAFNAYGVNGEYILFNHAEQLNYLTVSEYSGVQTMSVSLYGTGGNLLAQQTADFIHGAQSQLLTFNTNAVAKIVFDRNNGNATAAWYYVSDVNYSPNAAVPEPATLAVFGLGMAGLAAARRRRGA